MAHVFHPLCMLGLHRKALSDGWSRILGVLKLDATADQENGQCLEHLDSVVQIFGYSKVVGMV